MHASVQVHARVLVSPCACLHGGDVVAVHKELCPDHAGGGPPVYEAFIEHMMCRLDRAFRSAQTIIQ